MAETTDTQDFQPAGGTELRRAIGATLGSEVGDTASSLFERGQRETFGAARAKADREAAGAAAKAGATRDYATEMQRQTTAAEGRIGQMPQFEVNKDTQEGLMGLAALLPLAGLMLGIKGQTSGTNALNAMAGVMTGYKEGNQQRIEFERKKYDEEMNRWKANYGMVKDGLERAMSIAKANLQAGQAEAERVAATVGSPELKAMIQSQGLGAVYEKVLEIGKEKAKHDEKIKNPAEEKAREAIRGQIDQLRTVIGEDVNRLGSKEIVPVISSLESVTQTKELSNLVRANPQAAGVIGRTYAFMDQYLPQRYGTDKQPNANEIAAAASADTKIFEGIPPDQIAAARAIQKKVIDIINARTRAATGGVFRVGEFNAQKANLALTNMSPQTAAQVYEYIANDDIQMLGRYLSPETVEKLRTAAGSEAGRRSSAGGGKQTDADPLGIR